MIEKVEPFIFLHGGISPQVDALNLSYDEINYWGRYRMDSVCQSTDCNIINGGTAFGIYWYRGMANENLTQQQVNTIISNFDGEMVVIGHTVFDNITLLYENKVICIDLDHKGNFLNGFMNALYYEDGNLYDFYTDGVNQIYTLLINITSVDEPLQHPGKLNIEIFPNPAENSITVTSKNGLRIAEIAIYNQIGQKVLHHKPVTQPIDVSMLQPGRYIIEVNSQDLKIREKLIIR